MKNPKAELIWAGCIHLGDEPGTFGCAAFAGLSFELPFMLSSFTDGTATPPTPDIKLILKAEEVVVFPGYPGHKVTVTGYEPAPAPAPGALPTWMEVEICPEGASTGDPCEWRLTDDKLTLEFIPPPNIKFFSLRVRVDTTIAAGLYNDFIVKRLSLKSSTHFATFGFQFSLT